MGKPSHLLEQIRRLLTGDDDAALLIGVPATIPLNAFVEYGKSIVDLETISIVQAGAGVHAIKADLAGKKYLLMGAQLTGDTADTTCQFRETDDSPVYQGAWTFNDNGGICMPVTGFPYLTTADGKGLELITVTGGVNGMVQVLEVDI